MGLRISSNILSLAAHRALSQTEKAIQRSLNRLASGLRVNRAADDPAGLSISTGLEAQIRGLRQAIRNINDASAVLQTAEGGITTQIDLVQRMRELTVQAATGTLSDTERVYLNNELQSLYAEYNRLSNDTNFNGVKLLDGSFGTVRIQVGANARQQIDLNLAGTLASQIFTKEIGTNTYQNTYSSVVGQSSVADPLVADLNGDGNLDVYQINGSLANATIRLGRGDGTFVAATTLTHLNSGYGGAIADMNGDGKLDLITVTNHDRIDLNIGNGDGSFKAYQSLFVGDASSTGAIVLDVNGDNRLDIVSVDNTGYIAVVLGNGNGTFATTKTFAVGSAPVATPTSGDLNGDGFVDLLISSSTSNFVSVLLGNGNGTFAAASTVSVGGTSRCSPVVADLNGDGILDFIQPNQTTVGMAVRLGNGNGTFSAATTLSSTHAFLSSPTIIDLNGDGRLDVVAGDYSAQTISVFLGQGSGVFTSATTLSGIVNPTSSSQVVDLDGDGNLDILQSTSTTGLIYAYSGDGRGGFTYKSVSNALGPTGSANPKLGRPITGDFNNDGYLDFIVTNYDGSDVLSGSMLTFIQNTQIVSATSDINIATQSAAEDLLEILDGGLSNLMLARAKIGALESRLEKIMNVNDRTIEHLSSAKSQIMDVDMANEVGELVRMQILEKAGVSVLSHANLSAKLTLRLFESLNR